MELFLVEEIDLSMAMLILRMGIEINIVDGILKLARKKYVQKFLRSYYG